MPRPRSTAEPSSTTPVPDPTSEPATDGCALAVVVGHLSSDPTTTTLGSGSVLVRLQVTARVDGATATVPVAWFDPPRRVVVATGDRVVVVGTVRRRFFRAGGATASATEVVANTVARASPAALRRSAAALRSAADRLDR